MNIHAQRLLNVARALRECPDPSRFTMSREFHDCGTPACAWGHYVARTDLQDEFTINPGRMGYAIHRDGATFVTYSADEVLQHFGITQTETCELFSMNGCGLAITALQAATYIERFVARKWPGSVLDPAFVKLKGDLNVAAAVRMLEHS